MNDLMTRSMPRSMSAEAIAQENARFISGVYKWMTLGILCTALMAFVTVSSPELLSLILMNKFVFIGLIIAEFGLVIYLNAAIKKMSSFRATAVYLLYAALTGLTLSVVLLVYTRESVVNAFLVTACSFAGLSLFGYVTKKDLGPIGTFCGMALWGLIGFALLSFFIPSMMEGQFSVFYSAAGVLIFAGLTAYDTQKIKQLNIIGNEGTEEDHKETIHGALVLYLDFINLFLMILRLTGSRRK